MEKSKLKVFKAVVKQVYQLNGLNPRKSVLDFKRSSWIRILESKEGRNYRGSQASRFTLKGLNAVQTMW